MIRYALVAAALVSIFIESVHAETIHWQEFYADFGGKCGPGPERSCGDGVINGRDINVFTRDGHRHHAGTLCIAPDQVRLNCGDQKDTLARVDVVRIEVRNDGRFAGYTLALAEVPIVMASDACGIDIVSGGGHCNPFKFIAKFALLSPIWAYCVATAPVTLSMDAVSRMTPPIKFEIVP